MRRQTVCALAVSAALVISGCGEASEQSSPPAAVGVPSTTAPTVTPTAGSRTPSPAARPPQTAVGLPTSLLGAVITRIPTTRKMVALTFDGGANADGAAAILATLQRKGVPATFFLTGDFATRFPATSRRLAEWGRVGNHTVNHPHMTELTTADLVWQTSQGWKLITTVTGKSPKPWFRFPFGEYDPRTLRAVNASGWAAIGWTIDSRGWMGTAKGNTATAVAARVVAARTPGEIVLMHLGSHPTDHTTLDAAALPTVIDQLRGYGYVFVTVDTLLR